MSNLDELLSNAEKSIHSVRTLAELEAIRVEYFGKKGLLVEFLKKVGKLSAAERPAMGQAVNTVKQQLLALLHQKHIFLKEKALEEKLQIDKIDVSLPGRGEWNGSLHPTNQIADRLIEMFSNLGFTLEEGPEIEDIYHNFDALNIPPHHPARSDSDTFYFEDGRALRVHTSTVQVRCMETQKPPIKMVVYGRTYRHDVPDATHSPMFHQFEGLVIDKEVTFSDLKGLLVDFAKNFLGDERLKYRFRPSYFPFTEPSAELDIWFEAKNQWIELLGCGMVHPNVLKASGIDPKEYKGYAFGGGMDRLAMLFYGIEHLKTLFDNDIRFLRQF
jgi:phenylalanyl-tRNA synthetase alpha chain